MNQEFDELAKRLALAVTRRVALKKFGVGLVGAVLASLGLASNAEAGKGRPGCGKVKKICSGCHPPYGCSDSTCLDHCQSLCFYCFPGCC